MTYDLRTHQTEAISQIRKSMADGNKRVVLKAPCGFGKTLVSVDIIKSALSKNKKVLFIVDSIQLIDQTSDVFDRHEISHGIIQADHWRSRPFEDVQIASAQTLKNRKLPDVDLVIWDEGHIQHSFIIKLITEIWNAIPVITLSATPFAKNMGKIHHDLVCVETTRSLINKGYLSDFVSYGCSIDLEGVKTTAGEYNQKQLGEKVNKPKIVGDIVTTWLRLGQNRQTVCFAVNVAHSEAIADEFRANGIKAEHMDAYTDVFDRQEIFKKHESGEIKILVNCGITTKGWDSPNTTCMILARPTKSLMLYHQMCGRVLRVSDNGDEAIILDHGNNIQRLGFPDDDTTNELCTGEKQEKNAKKKDEIEKEIAAPKPCIMCQFLFNGLKCPQCGNQYFKTPNIIALEGELKKLEAKEKTPADKRNAQWSKEEKQSFYSSALSYAKDHGYKEGWAAMKYKDYLGVWPNAFEKVSSEITDKFKSFITANNIRYAKSQEKKKGTIVDNDNGFHSKPREGYIYSENRRTDGQLQIRIEKNGEFKGWAKQTPEMLLHIGVTV